MESKGDDPDRCCEASHWPRLQHAVTDDVTLMPTTEDEDDNTIAAAMRTETLGEEPNHYWGK
jgi:hypothetical protein